MHRKTCLFKKHRKAKYWQVLNDLNSLKYIERKFNLLDSLFGSEAPPFLSVYYVLDTADGCQTLSLNLHNKKTLKINEVSPP